MKKAIKRIVDSALVPLCLYVAEKLPPWHVLPPRRNPATELDALRLLEAVRIPGNPCLKGFKVFSQNDEDGIIEEILNRVDAVRPLGKTFIEIGCGNGLENNSHYLLLKGFKGCWVDGDPKNLEFIRTELGDLEFPRLQARQCFIDLSNIGELISSQVKFLDTREPDMFSLDIDGNDLWVLQESLRHIDPKMICVEYNPKFPPPLAVSIAYNPSHTWVYDDYQGASLQAFCNGLPGYQLVCCNLCGVNAFFVRKDLAAGFASTDSRVLFQPFREHLTSLVSGHRPSLKWLRNELHASASKVMRASTR
jgi:hypothetical protein